VTSEGSFELRLDDLPEGGSVVRVDGELDLATAPDLEELLARVDLGERLVVDLSLCTVLDSSALRILISTITQARERGGEVSLVAPEPGIARVLEIASVNTMADVHPTLDAAI
jgi:anti-sigma B factor antagonist